LVLASIYTSRLIIYIRAAKNILLPADFVTLLSVVYILVLEGQGIYKKICYGLHHLFTASYYGIVNIYVINP